MATTVLSEVGRLLLTRLVSYLLAWLQKYGRPFSVNRVSHPSGRFRIKNFFISRQFMAFGRIGPGAGGDGGPGGADGADSGGYTFGKHTVHPIRQCMIATARG